MGMGAKRESAQCKWDVALGVCWFQLPSGTGWREGWGGKETETGAAPNQIKCWQCNVAGACVVQNKLEFGVAGDGGVENNRASNNRNRKLRD